MNTFSKFLRSEYRPFIESESMWPETATVAKVNTGFDQDTVINMDGAEFDTLKWRVTEMVDTASEFKSYIAPCRHDLEGVAYFAFNDPNDAVLFKLAHGGA